MARRPVTHTQKYSDDTIRAIAFPGAAWSPRRARDAIRDIEEGRHSYYVPWRDGEVGVHVVDHWQGKYLRTDWDDTPKNNLADLPEPSSFDPRDRASITTWTRLEPRSRSGAIEDGLAAPLYDPLWLLARQWQLGEFALTDGGSPITARLRGSVTRLEHYRAGPAAPGTDPEWRSFDPAAVPLEVLVEREPVSGPQWDERFAADAGLHFLRLLRVAGLTRLAAAYLALYPVAAPSVTSPSDAAGRRYVQVLAGRVPAGNQLYAELDSTLRPPDGTTGRLPEQPTIDPADREHLTALATDWLVWCDRTGPATGAAPTSWDPDRLEHTFAVAGPAPHTDATITFDATGYPGGHLDWYAFDARVTPAGPRRTTAEPIDQTTLPTPVVFPGMPGARWWELEDTRINVAAVETPREDLAQMLLLECALVYGNDWFLIPLELPVGTVCRLDSLEVTDGFGHVTEVRPVREHDPQWRMFSLTGLDAADEVLLLPPALGESLTGAPLEEVLLLRDEMANLAWAVERLAPDGFGDVVDRAEVYARNRDSRDHPPEGRPEPATDAAWIYRLTTDVPDYWIPLVPVAHRERQVRLRRGTVLRHDGAAGTTPHGRLLALEQPLSLFEEEVPRAGVRLVRSDQYARWLHGSTHLWRSRHKRPGRGEGASGLRFDLLIRAAAAPQP